MKPTLVVVSGKPGSGKTTLAYKLGKAIGCPVICRDVIKEGIVRTLGDGPGISHESMNRLALEAFFETIERFVKNSVTVVVEAAFGKELWIDGLKSILEDVSLRVIDCQLPGNIAEARMRERLQKHPHQRSAHQDEDYLSKIKSGEYSLDNYQTLSLGVPTLGVSTLDGYDPDIDTIAYLLKGKAQS